MKIESLTLHAAAYAIEGALDALAIIMDQDGGVLFPILAKAYSLRLKRT